MMSKLPACLIDRQLANTRTTMDNKTKNQNNQFERNKLTNAEASFNFLLSSLSFNLFKKKFVI